jgi:pyroglutamyl-peptidase
VSVLVVGFEPFDGATVNPSGQLAAALGGEIAPVDSKRIGPWLDEVLARRAPTVVLGLGESRTSAVIRVERVAVNLLDFEIPDAGGAQPHEQPVVRGGPPAYFTELPARKIRDAIRSAGLPATLSVGAGTYLCNQFFYLACHRGLRTGFLHLPSLPEQVAYERRPGPTMDLAAQLRAVQAVLGTLEL